MTDTTVGIGAVLLIAGGILIVLELVHPGIFLLIPGSTLLAGGLLYLVLPDFLTGSPAGPLLVALVAVGAAIGTIPLYRHYGTGGPPMTTTPESLAGQEAMVIVPVIPDTLKGKVRVGSEIWSARSDAPIAVGVRVKVLGGSGVSLNVVPVSPSNPRP
jgi:membrane protein implicated in regulation of membrane protease activity